MSACAPDWEDSFLGRLFRACAGEECGVHFSAVEHAGFPGEDIEAHLLVEEPDEAMLGEEGGTVAMRLLAQGDDSGGADFVDERHEVFEVVIGGVDGANGDGVLFEPFDLGCPGFVRVSGFC